MKSKNKGFTFIELVIVIIMMGIMSTAAVIGYTSYRSTARTRAAEKVVEALDYARAFSQVSNRGVFVSFREEGDNLIGEIYSVNGTEKNVKETYSICNKEYKLTYKETGDEAYTQLPSDEEIVIGFNKATSGFASSMNYEGFRIDFMPETQINFIKGTGRAYLESEMP